jgi:hypothetical protein
MLFLCGGTYPLRCFILLLCWNFMLIKAAFLNKLGGRLNCHELVTETRGFRSRRQCKPDVIEVLYTERKSSPELSISPISISSFTFSPVAFPSRVLSFPPLASWFPPCISGRSFSFFSSGVRFLIGFMSRLDRGAAGHCAPLHFFFKKKILYKSCIKIINF